MKPTDLKQLYNEVIMKHQKSPYHFEKREEEPSFTATNPMCGDTYKVYLEGDKNSITEASFHGIGCALSKASASILMKAIEGRNRDEVLAFCRDFIAAADGKKEWHASEEIDMLTELRNHGGRMDCIKLTWEALSDYLEENKS